MIVIKKGIINTFCHLQNPKNYHTSFGGVKRAHAAGTFITIVKVQVILGMKEDSIVLSDENKSFELEIVPHQLLLERMNGLMTAYFYSEIDFRPGNKGIRLLHPVENQNIIGF